jgi:hypothetical protein
MIKPEGTIYSFSIAGCNESTEALIANDLLARSCPPLMLIAFLEAVVETLRSRQFIQLTR